MTETEVMARLEKLETKMDQIIKLQKGGNQPSTKFKVMEDGGPSKTTMKVMKKAKKGGKFVGATSSEVENIFEEELEKKPTRNTTLKRMRKIADEFDPYKFKKGKGGESSALYYQP